MTGVIDVGGGMRGIYGAGVFDGFLDGGINFDAVVGISAGSANAASFLAGQKGRNVRFYENYSFRKEYMSLKNFIEKGSYIDLEYVYETLSVKGGEDPLDCKKLKDNPAALYVLATNAVTGESIAFTKDDFNENDYFPLMASSCLPIVGKPVFKDGVPFYDGGMSDPVPVKMLCEAGCDKIVLILTKPKDVLRTPGKDAYAAKLLKKKYPKAAEGLFDRYRRYNEGVLLAKKLEKDGKALIIAPDDCCGVDTLKRTKESLEALYKKGYNDSRAALSFLSA